MSPLSEDDPWELVLRLEDLPLSALLPEPRAAQDAVVDAGRLTAVVDAAADDVDHVEPLVADLLAEAAAELDTALGLVNVVLPGVQVLVAAHGLTGWLAEARATPVEWSLCATVVRTGQPYVVGDLGADADTAGNPLHLVDGLRAYAGMPLRGRGGEVLGAFCVLDTRPRTFTARELEVLAELAETASQRVQDAAPGCG